MPNSASSWPDWKYPEWRASGELLTSQRWLERKTEEDGAEGLWRVGDGLYDLSAWISAHPGGPMWLQVTKGTDITEAFEAHHLGPLPSKILPNFYVREAKTPRNSVFTFKPDGFYRTLKTKVYEKLKDVKPGPSALSKGVVDSLASGTVVLSILAGVYSSYILGTLAGIFLALTTICAHNFFHLRDNWRMYLFNMSLFTVREWRVSHAISHHLYPNTHYDLEISMFEPFLRYFPSPDKSRLFGVASAVVSPIYYPFITTASAIIRLVKISPHLEDMVGLLLPALMMLVGGVSLWSTLSMWLYIVANSSFLFGLIGLNAAHHHPDIFHYGDKPRDDRDWGLHTLDATRDRVDVYGVPYLVLITFGDHTLHHLFPTLDHTHLHGLYPLLEDTCRQFGIEFRMRTQWDLLKGQFLQLMRNQPNLNSRSY